MLLDLKDLVHNLLFFFMEVIDMAMYEKKRIISILMESLLYKKLSLKEKESLLIRLMEICSSMVKNEDEEIVVGYESSWAGIVHFN